MKAIAAERRTRAMRSSCWMPTDGASPRSMPAKSPPTSCAITGRPWWPPPARISHGRGASLVVRPMARALTDLGAAHVAASEGSLRTDQAQLLVTTLLGDTVPSPPRTPSWGTRALPDPAVPAAAAFERDTRKRCTTSTDLKACASRSPSAPPRSRPRAVAAGHMAFVPQACRDRLPGLHAHPRVRQHRHRHHRQTFQDADWWLWR